MLESPLAAPVANQGRLRTDWIAAAVAQRQANDDMTGPRGDSLGESAGSLLARVDIVDIRPDLEPPGGGGARKYDPELALRGERHSPGPVAAAPGEAPAYAMIRQAQLALAAYTQAGLLQDVPVSSTTEVPSVTMVSVA